MIPVTVHNLNSNKITTFDKLYKLKGLIDNKTCIGYTRQSTSSQKSISGQIDEIKNKAKIANFNFIIIFQCEGSGWKVSNKLNKLIGFKNMINIIKHIRDISNESIQVYIYDVSRFMRNVLVATKYINEIFDPYDCIINSIIDNKRWSKNNTDRIEFLRELVEAEKFSVTLSNKMKRVMKNQKERGNHIGGIKYGYERFKNKNIFKLRKSKLEQNILGFIKKESNCIKFISKNKDKNKAYNKICNILNKCEFYKRGREWNKNIIKNTILNNLKNVKECELDIEGNSMEITNNNIKSLSI